MFAALAAAAEYELELRAERQADLPWVVLYVKRRLAAPLALPDGTLQDRDRGTHRGRRSHPSWRICSCTTRSTPGWPGNSRTWCSSATPTTRSCTAPGRGRQNEYWRRSRNGWPRSGFNCTPAKPGSCTARTTDGAAHTSTRRSRSSGSPSGREGCARRPGRCAAASTRRSARSTAPRCIPSWPASTPT